MTSDFIYVLFSPSGKENFSFENLVDFFFFLFVKVLFSVVSLHFLLYYFKIPAMSMDLRTLNILMI